jgi:drug/metabolite transporter (DMT)-like permease
MTHRSAVSLLLIVALLWSLGGVLIKSVDWHPMGIAGTRSAIAAMILWAWLRRPRFTWSLCQCGAALSYVGTVCFFVAATRWTTAANAIFLQYTAPIYVAIAAPLVLGERARSVDWLCVLAALGGIALFLKDDFTPTGGWGITAALASGVSFATMVLLLRRDKEGTPLSSLLLGNLTAALIGAPFMIAEPPPAGAWLPLVSLGVFQLGIPYLLYGIAMRGVTAMEATLIPMLEPVLNPLWVGLAIGEVPGPWSLAGAALVLAAVLVRAVARRPA